MSDTAYTGIDNLEVMEDAVNYNRFLLGAVRESIPSGCREVLEFGAGTGTFARALAAEGYTVACVEVDSTLLRSLGAQGLDARASLDAWGDRRWRCIYTVNVLEHIDDDEAALRALAARLEPGGVLYVYVPAFQTLFSAMDARVGHVRRYGRDELVAKVSRAGFTVEDVRYHDSLGFAASLAYKHLGVGGGDGRISPWSLKLFDRAVFPVSRVVDRVAHGVVGKNLGLRARR